MSFSTFSTFTANGQSASLLQEGEFLAFTGGAFQLKLFAGQTQTLDLGAIGLLDLKPLAVTYSTTRPPELTGFTLGLSTQFTLRPAVAAPVPEPASWAMLIAGFGLVGAAMRTRHPAPARAV